MNEILRIGEKTRTFQAHPELSVGYSQALTEPRGGEPGEDTYRERLGVAASG